MRVTRRWVFVALGAVAAVAGFACNGSQSGPDACISAGGQCILGSAIGTCAKQGPPGCNDPPSPGGAFCCLAFLESGDAMADAAVLPTVSDAGCPAPDAATYSCAPQPLDAGGCLPWGSDDAGSVSYPIGCVATTPQCSAFTNYTSAQTCNCSVLFDGGPEWICPG